MALAKQFTEEQIKDIIIKYKQGISKLKLAQSFGATTNKCITRILKQYNIKPEDRNIRMKNKHIFDVIDTVDKAYWLGFIVGDGCIATDDTRLSIKLAAKDKQHLVKFADFMNLPYTMIKDGMGNYNNPITYIYVSSKYVVNKLQERGIHSRKSGIEHVPTGIPEEFYRDYLRGLIDADGCILDANRGKYHVDVSNSIENLTSMINYIKKVLNIPCPRIFEHEGTYRIYYSNLKDTYKILKHIYYSDNITYLDRKYARAKVVFNKYYLKWPQQEETT